MARPPGKNSKIRQQILDAASRLLRRVELQGSAWTTSVRQTADSGEPRDDGPSLRKSLCSLFTRARESGDVPPQADVEFLADGYAYLWFMLCAQWLARRDDAQFASRLAQLTAMYAPSAPAIGRNV